MDVTFRAYFTEGKNIGDFNVLGDLAEEAGVMSKDKVCSIFLFKRLARVALT